MILLLAVIYIVFISLGLPDSVFGVIWPVLHKELGVAESFASIYNIIVGVCTSAVSALAGILIRKFGTGKVTAVSILLTVIGLVGISFSPNIVVMMIFAIILGYGAGAIDTGLNNFVSHHYKAQHMNWLHCFWGIGVTLSPIIMSFFLKDNSWRNGCRTIALIQTVILVIVIGSLPLWKKADSPIAENPDEEKGNKKFFEIFKKKGLVQSILSLSFYFAMENLIGTWAASYIVHIYSLNASTASMWVSLYYGGIMLGRFIAGFIAIKLSDNSLIRLGIGVSFAGIIFMLLPIGKTAICGLLLIGVGFGPIFPSVLHTVPARFGKEYSADITGYHLFGAYAVGFIIQLAFGYTATSTSFIIMPYVLIVLSAVMCFMNEYVIKKLSRQ
ncbi:MAG: MFS transporter [Oscillospiraceae bacterium]|nr:MFS transporter [Oscillospiraceae bacterium]